MFIDMSRASSCFSGREILTDEQPRKLRTKSVVECIISMLRLTYDDAVPCRSCCTSVVP